MQKNKVSNVSSFFILIKFYFLPYFKTIAATWRCACCILLFNL